MLSENFTKFALSHLENKKQNFHLNENTAVLLQDIPVNLTKLAAISDKYRVYGSVGQGQWSEIPWVAILDKDITTSTQNGYYIVFLFSADMKQIFLSLAVGWTQYEHEYGIKEGRIAIEVTIKQLQKVLRSPLGEFSFSKRGLKATTILGKGYESGGICHKVYDADRMPNDEVIINDLRNLMGVYRELKGLVGKDILDLEIPESELLEYEIPVSEVNPEFIPNFRLQKYIPKNTEKIADNRHKPQVDFDERNKLNSKTGHKGEEIVINDEKSYLMKIGRGDLANKVDWVSKYDNSAGYDILSFDKDGNKKFIEVKTTVLPKKKEFSFNISSNEKSLAEKTSNYFIYLVFDVNSFTPKIVTIKNPFSLGMLYLEPTNYRVRGLTE